MVLRQFGVLMALRLRGLRELQRQCPAPQPALSQAVARLSVSAPSPHARMQAPVQVSRVEQHVLASQDDARRQRPRGVQQPKTQVPTTKADGRKPGGTAKKRVKRRRIPYLASFTPRPELPSLDALVVVEGIADGRAVAAAVNAPVLVCVGTTVVGSAGKEQLKGIADKFEDVIVFMDPDHEGRTIRNKLEEWIGPTRHAFMPLPALGVGSSSAAGFKTGVQYAPAEATRKALFSACTSDREREEFRREDLEDMGLVQPNGVRGVNVKLRRKEFCAFLGLGPCDGRQLLKQLNWYGFSRSQAAEAAAYSQRCVDAWVLAHGSKEDSQ